MPGGIWYGQLIPPATEPAGPACAIAYSGDFPDGEWRGVITPIQMQAYEDPAPLLILGSPEPLDFRAGGSVNLFGTAVNAAENSITLQIVDAAGMRKSRAGRPLPTPSATGKLISPSRPTPHRYGGTKHHCRRRRRR
jgi:hypothetical protein